ncbi:uncharacterized protein LOC119074037 [Bradysia coprophila]|uniref:uncharacterized protein LOC119074037 n=1 Tax=Bradysia coprophila TaxID=38358 RepID=UPI00187DD23A|nr:uncharacterized protein LOC119074037 [Bradysia coprophila]
MLDLMLKRQKHVDLLNSLVQLDSNLRKVYTNNKNYGNNLLTMHRQIVFVVCFYAAVLIVTSTINWYQMAYFEHLWNLLQFFLIISITLVAYYVRCIAVILNHICLPIFERLDSIANDLRSPRNDHQKHIVSEVMDCFESFDDVMSLKNQLSSIFGIQLLLNSAFDFIILTISVYGLLYFQTKSLLFLYYVTFNNIPHIFKSVSLVLALDKLANQISTLRWYALKISVHPNHKLSELMDLIFLKITHMEKDKYVTANDFYPINRSMLYGVNLQ